MDRLVYERFGSRGGFVHYVRHSILSWLGVYRKFSRIHPGSFERLVFVCSGNICRSPLAEVYARSLGKQAASCGLNCGDGFPADPRAMAHASQFGLSLEDHRTVNVKDFEFRSSDLIVVMEPAHLTSFQEKVGGNYRLVLAGSFCRRPSPYIHDPYNCCIEFFTHCENKVLEAVRGICG
ncbi:protein-tyrosine phosphatase [Marinobacter zhejiangensis]|uniref:protein-tyrosine-phosphatase n=1 Tax=Marinobacter zhejiangensis TaxID=488535 RepID=A0A1I4RMS0_9GAMM|nr:protein-tyrosine phosphatase [Marinobacter zhejiangensis]